MKLVITGALGHIGSYLIRYLPTVIPDCKLLLIDNLTTQRFCSLYNLPTKGQYQFVEADVTQIDLRPLITGSDAVVHLAAITDAASSFKNATNVELNNYSSTKKIIDACIECSVPLIMASSTSVYGTQSEQVDEDCSHHDLRPQSPYAATKLKEEALVISMAKRNLRASILRFGTIFGTSPGMRFHTAVNKFCWQAVMGLPLTVWSTAFNQKRPYLDLIDCSKAIAFILCNDLFHGEIFNVVTANVTVRDVVDEIRRHIASVEIKFVDHEIMNQLSYDVMNKKLAGRGFKVEGSLAIGIEETIDLLLTSNLNEQ